EDQELLRAAASPTPRRPRPTQQHSTSARSTSGPMPSRAALVGREDELARVLPLLQDVAAGATGGRLLFLAGEPGVGKSHLARELIARAYAIGFRFVVGRCFEQHARLPFFPFSEAVGTALAEMPPQVRATTFEQWPELDVL